LNVKSLPGLIACVALTATALGAPGGYLFATFKNGSTPQSEQIYFGISQDGKTWTVLNGSQPALVSYIGTKGVRDAYLVRSHDGTRFYLLATDLSTYYLNGNWTAAVQSGSHSIVIWESPDLVNWSPPRLANVAPADAGCTWAPEAIYDDTAGDYLVYWAGTSASDGYSKQRIWACRTADFKTFGAPFIYVERANHVIDADIVKDGATFYRFTKDETVSALVMETSSSLLGTWTTVGGFSLTGVQGYEGPEAYQLLDGTWCLVADHIATSSGYAPFTTGTIASGSFAAASGFTFPFAFRHGGVLPITADEYTRVSAALQSAARIQTHLLFNEASGAVAADAAGHAWDATLANNPSHVAGRGGNAISLNGSNAYVSLPAGVVYSLSNFTVSAWVKINSLAQWSRIFDFGTGTSSYMFLTPKAGGTGNVRFAIATSGNTSEQQINGSAPLPTGVWTHVAVTLQGSLGILYVNGVEVGRNSSLSLYPALLNVTTQNWLGRSQFSGDPYLNAQIDDFRIYSAGLSANAVQALYSGTAGALPSPWSDRDLGTPAIVGSSGTGDTYTALSAAGTGIQGTADQGHFTYQPWTGDGMFTVCLGSVSANTSPAANAGIMFREDMTDSSRCIYLGMTQTGVVTWQHRDSIGGAMIVGVSSSNNPNPWLRVTRYGNVFTAYVSPDGASWSQIANPVTVALAQTLNVGMAMTSGSNTALETARFSNMSLGNPAPAAPGGLSAAASGKSVELTWNSVPGATSYTVKRSMSSGGPFTVIASSVPSGRFTDSPTADGSTYYYVVTGSNSGGESSTSPVASTILYSDYQQWKIASGLSISVADNVISGADGLPVLLKFALGCSPGAAVNTAPVSISSPARGITFTRLAPAPAQYIVQGSSDLSSWTTIASLAYGSDAWTGTGSVVEDTTTIPRKVTVYDDPAFGSAPKRFLRLQVQRTVP